MSFMVEEIPNKYIIKTCKVNFLIFIRCISNIKRGISFDSVFFFQIASGSDAEKCQKLSKGDTIIKVGVNTTN